MALRLAMADGATAVLYLARPCQLTTRATKKACALPYWSGRRFSEEVVSSMNRAVSHYQMETGARRLVIIGYSGGGAVAALIAARRDDVALLITVAGTLNHRIWTSHHEVSPLTGSLNPVDQAPRLAAIQQTHFVGADDEIVPNCKSPICANPKLLTFWLVDDGAPGRDVGFANRAGKVCRCTDGRSGCC